MVVCRGVLDTSCVLILLIFHFASTTPWFFFFIILPRPTLKTIDAPKSLTFFFPTYPLFFFCFLDSDSDGGGDLQITGPPTHNQPCYQEGKWGELCSLGYVMWEWDEYFSFLLSLRYKTNDPFSRETLYDNVVEKHQENITYITVFSSNILDPPQKLGKGWQLQ